MRHAQTFLQSGPNVLEFTELWDLKSPKTATKRVQRTNTLPSPARHCHDKLVSIRSLTVLKLQLKKRNPAQPAVRIYLGYMTQT